MASKKSNAAGSQTAALWEQLAAEDLDEKLYLARQEGRRQGLGEAVKAIRVAIDARFKLTPQEFDIGELPEGLDIGEILEAQNRFFNEFGKRCYYDGIEFMKEHPEGKDRQTWRVAALVDPYAKD